MDATHRQHTLRRGRSATERNPYLITTATFQRQPLFKNTRAAQIVFDTLKWLDERGRYALCAAVVMPDHIHFVAELEPDALTKIIHSLKSYSANEINHALNRRGPVWQSQYHDHGIRNEEQLNNAIRYCIDNPVRAGLVKDFREYPFVYCRYDV